jgi:citronellyl-CoA dehydrogenase
MHFTHEHTELQRNLKRFIDNEINPFVDEWEEAEIFPAKELFKKMGDLGFLGISRQPEFGGLGLDYSYSIAMAETLGHVNCGGVPMAIGVQTDMATPALARFGSDALRHQFLAPAIAGDMVACVGVSEPSAGSDVANIKTTARKDGDDYIINGSKMWITNSLQADWMCLLANTSNEGSRYANKSLIIVPMNTKGVSVGKKIKKIGMHSSDTGLIYFDDVRVPQSNLIGQEGQGFIYQMLQFQEERLWGAANSVQGLMNCLDQTIAYAKERQVFDMRLIDNQWMHFRMAELKTEIECLRALVYRAGDMYLEGQDVPDTCLQFWGGMGYTHENPVSRFYRDGRLISIGGGTDEVMLGIICKYMHILPGKKKS